MVPFSLFFLLLFSPLLAVQPDASASKFELREKKKQRVETFDFTEVYPNLEEIDIDGKKKKCVELTLTGEFPVLEKILYEGTFGVLTGKLTGQFTKLKEIDLICKSCKMDLDFRGKWQQSCAIHVCTLKENMTIKLPKDVGIILKTKVGLKGKVLAPGFSKQGKFGILNKIYKNELADTAEVVLTLNLETIEGVIVVE